MTARTRLLVDGHVHFHSAHRMDVFIESAIGNLSRNGSGIPTLLMTEGAGAHVFRDWIDGKCACEVGRTSELDSIMLADRLLVIAGRQVVTAERIEVLALATASDFEDGLSLNETIEAVKAAGGIPILPWGVGKWFGERGRLVVEAVRKHGVMVGDNAGRPLGWPKPPLFNKHPVIPGSDPLKAEGEERMVGRYGFILECDFDSQRPAESIRRSLRALQSCPATFGARVGPARFFLRQIKHSLG